MNTVCMSMYVYVVGMSQVLESGLETKFTPLPSVASFMKGVLPENFVDLFLWLLFLQVCVVMPTKQT